MGCIGWAIERHLDAVPPKLMPIFQKILQDTKIRKDNLERSEIDLFYNLLHKRPIHTQILQGGNSGALWVGGDSPGYGLPGYPTFL